MGANGFFFADLDPNKRRGMFWFEKLDPPGSAVWNMACDEYLIQRAVQAKRPILRLYQWSEMTLSLGRNQRVERQVDMDACQRLGIGLIRRVTGGQAVLHGGDLTYSVTSPLQGTGFEGGIMVVYREISRALVQFFENLGMKPEVMAYTGRERAQMASPVCFVTPSAFEIIIDGKKLVGSAQRLLPNGFLQHGSIPLEPQAELLSKIFHNVTQADIENTMTDMASLGFRLPVDALGEKMVEAFLSAFEASVDPLPWGEKDDEAVREMAGKIKTDMALPPNGQTRAV